MEFSTVKKQVKVTIDGKEHMLSMPKLRHQIIWDEIFALGDQNKGYASKLVELLEELGLPKSVSLELEEDEIVAIIKGIGEAKKKQTPQPANSPA